MVDLPLWKIWVRQLGWWNSQYDGKNNPVMFQSPPTRVILIRAWWCFFSEVFGATMMDWNTWAETAMDGPNWIDFFLGFNFSQESLVISADFRDKTMKCYKLTLKIDENRWLACSRWYWYRLDLQHFYLDSRVDKQVIDRIPGWIMTWNRNSPWQKNTHNRWIHKSTGMLKCMMSL